MTTTEKFEFTSLQFPVTTLSADRYTKAQAEDLLAKYSDRITVKHGQHAEVRDVRFVAETFTAEGEPWNWDYRGESRYDLERAVMTWLIVNDLDEDLGHTMVVTLP